MAKELIPSDGELMPSVDIFHHRTAQQVDEDFSDTCRLLLGGNTWNQIAAKINKNRPYNLGVNSYSKIYRDRLKEAGLQRVATDELERAIEDCDTMMMLCMREFEASKQGYESTTEVFDKKVIYKGEVAILTDKYTAIGKKVKKVRNGSEHKYLELWLKFHTKKSEYLNLDKPDTLDINVFLKAHTLDDDRGGFKAPPIMSEEQARLAGSKME